MTGVIRYTTEHGNEGLVMIDQIAHITRSGAPAITQIFLHGGGVLRSKTDLETLEQRINYVTIRMPTEQAKSCHFGHVETE